MMLRKSTMLIFAFCVCLVLPLCLNADTLHGRHRSRPRYRLIDLGTLGGPHSYGSVNGDGFRLLNDEAVVTSYADTTKPDANSPNACFVADCLVAHAFRWKGGNIADIGALPGMNSSAAGAINERGWSTGQSQIGFDAEFGAPDIHAVLWKHHDVVDLGTLGGKFSLGLYINNAGQVIGFSDNTTPDPFALFPTGRQTRAFIWDDGAMQDIGTLGGPDAVPSAGCDNQREDFIAGVSFTSFTPNANTGIPTLEPFLWRHGKMVGLGSLGGTMAGSQCVNNRGEVIGFSTVPGDIVTHAFVWDDGLMKDLGTLGGDNSEAIWINDSGEIVGSADLPGVHLHDAVLWKDGIIHDLGTVDGDACSRGRAINAKGQVVGGSSDCSNFLHAFVWEKGEGIKDLNSLVAPGSGLQITNAFNINNRGEILAKSVPLGVTPIDDEDLGHLVLLIPCDRDEGEGCAEFEDDDTNTSAVKSPAANRVGPARRPMTPKDNVAVWKARLARQYHFKLAQP
jgi:probable HAF family extracellular repeat protein